jgi:hypothetical protein
MQRARMREDDEGLPGRGPQAAGSALDSFISWYDTKLIRAPGSRRVAACVKRYKYQALVTLYPGNDRGLETALGSAPRRMVVRGLDEEAQRSQFFTALVSCDDDGPFRPGRPQLLVTLRLAGDDVADYFAVGGHFGLWLGSDVGQGVVTRRLFV